MIRLTPKQSEELNFAIYEYLLKKKYQESAVAF